MINKILNFDAKISKAIRIPEKRNFWRKISSFVAHSGDSWYIEIALLVIWFFSSGKTHSFTAYLAGSVVIQALLVIAIKFIIKRKRPEGDWGEVYRNTDPHSFPSGHAARAIMLSVLACGFNFPALSLVILIWGIAVSFARVALGVHFLVDIIVGWILGVLIGITMLRIQPFIFQLFPFAF